MDKVNIKHLKSVIKELPDDIVVCNDQDGEYFSIEKVTFKKDYYVTFDGEEKYTYILVIK